MFDLGFQELIVIFLVALLVVGPKKLPELSRNLGKWVVEIKRSINRAKWQIETEFEEIENKSEVETTPTPPEAVEIQQDKPASDEEKEQT